MEGNCCQCCLIGIAFFVFLCTWNVRIEAEKAILLHKNQNLTSWQWSTRFEFGPYSGWSRDDNSGGYTVCDLPQTAVNHTESWLVSEYVDLQGANEVHMELEFTTRQCPSELRYCKESFNVYMMQTKGSLADGITDGDVHSGNFILVASVNATKLWTPGISMQGDRAKNLFDVSRGQGLYLAFQDQGACVALISVTLSYKYCPNVIKHGAIFDKTPAPSSSQINMTVIGNCFNGALVNPSSGSTSQTCLSSGQWLANDEAMCLCAVGYELAGDSCFECSSGYYKDSMGNRECIPCPSHSNSSFSRDSCPCVRGFYRAPQDAPNVSCTAPPSEPRNINITVVTDNVVIVAWSRPRFDGGRADLKYELRCSACANMGLCSDSCAGARFWPPEIDNVVTPQVIITNLYPEVLYNITVIAKNGVSDQAGMSSVKSLHATFSLKEASTDTPNTTTLRFPETAEKSTDGNLTATEAAESLGQENSSSNLPAAIGISVAVTLVVCFVVAAIIIVLLTKSWKKNPQLGHHSAQSSFTQVSEVSTDATQLKRLRAVTTTSQVGQTDNELPDRRPPPSPPPIQDRNHNSPLTSSASNDLPSWYRKKPLPAINIQDVNSDSRYNSAEGSGLVPLRRKLLLPPLKWSPPRAISPVLLPRRKKSVPPSPRVGLRNSPEGSENGQHNPSSGWFPAEEVQYNV